MQQDQEEWVDPFPPSRGDMPSPTGGFGPGLYERYVPRPSSRSTVRSVGHSPTRSSRIRSQGTKLACYLNGFASSGGATMIHLPAECDTLGEVLPKIQQLMHLDKKILYAAELFLPDGTKIDNFPMLISHADNHTAIIVGCGEAFDPTTVPFDLVEAYLNGGGREGPRRVNRQLAEKRLQSRHMQADSVRASGHGVFPNSVASVTARSSTVASNAELAAEMRHEYMEQVRRRYGEGRVGGRDMKGWVGGSRIPLILQCICAPRQCPQSHAFLPALYVFALLRCRSYAAHLSLAAAEAARRGGQGEHGDAQDGEQGGARATS
jgi:hypothetical protein